MSKFNTIDRRSAVRAPAPGPLAVASFAPSTTTALGAPGWTRTPQSELFLLASSNLVGEETFHEAAGARDARYEALVAAVAVDDPVWLARMLRWLRTGGNMRTAALVGAVEMVRARIGRPVLPAYDVPGWNSDRSIERAVIDAVCRRADEPGELYAYAQQVFGRRVPLAIKKGVTDAILRLYTEYSLLKYDTASHALRFGDLIELLHPAASRALAERAIAEPDEAGVLLAAEDMESWLFDANRAREEQIGAWMTKTSDLFRYAIERRHGRNTEAPASLRMVAANVELRRLVGQGRHDLLALPDMVAKAGMDWRDVLSLAGDKVAKAELWEALLPKMPIFAGARNLRNMDEAGVDNDAIAPLVKKFMDAEHVRKSGILPYQWLSAYREAPSLRWSYPLETALQHSLANVPSFRGRTLVMLDTSGSMTSKLSDKSKLTLLEAGAVFAVALAAKGEQVDLHGFADGVFAYPLAKGASIVREVEAISRMQGRVGHGTNIAGSLMASYAGHDRVVVITDEQTMCANAATTRAVPQTVPMYCFNLGGYRAAAGDWGSPNRVQLGGLTDATFRLIPTLEAGRVGDWSTVFGD